MLIAGGLTALWFAVGDALPPLAGIAGRIARVRFDLQCGIVALPFCFASAVPTIARQRSPAGIAVWLDFASCSAAR